MFKKVPFQTIQLSMSTVLLSKTFLFQAIQFSQTVLIQRIQFSISMQFSSIQPIDRALSGTTIPGQSGPGSNGNEEVLHIPQSSSITGTSPLDCSVSYLGHSLGGSPLCRGAVGVFYSPSRLDKIKVECPNITENSTTMSLDQIKIGSVT